MANPRSRKRDFDRAKKERAAKKRERRQRPVDGDEPTPDDEAVGQPALANEELLSHLQQIHERYLAEEIEFEEFERAKEAILAHLATD